jgi:hypothetical protein
MVRRRSCESGFLSLKRAFPHIVPRLSETGHKVRQFRVNVWVRRTSAPRQPGRSVLPPIPKRPGSCMPQSSLAPCASFGVSRRRRPAHRTKPGRPLFSRRQFASFSLFQRRCVGVDNFGDNWAHRMNSGPLRLCPPEAGWGLCLSRLRAVSASVRRSARPYVAARREADASGSFASFPDRPSRPRHFRRPGERPPAPWPNNGRAT